MDEQALALREELRAFARARGADSIGITSAEAFDAQVPNKQKSSSTALGMKTLIVFGRDPGALRNLYASGGIGFLHDMVEAAGGADVFGDVKRESVQATTEQLIARAPEIIIELRADDEAAPDVEAWNVVPSIPAVRNHRVVVLAGSEMVTAGPRVAKATERIARALHPEVY
jgi:iron complex transport system substrate-binding protein